MASIAQLIASGGADVPEVLSVAERQKQAAILEQQRFLMEETARKRRESQRAQLDQQRMGEALALGDWEKGRQHILRTAPGMYPAFTKLRIEEEKAAREAKEDENKAAVEYGNQVTRAISGVISLPNEEESTAAWAAAMAPFPEFANIEYPGRKNLRPILGVTALGKDLHARELQLKQEERLKIETETAKLKAQIEADKAKAGARLPEAQQIWVDEYRRVNPGASLMDALTAYDQRKPATPKLLTPEEEAQQLRLRKASQAPDQGKTTLMMAPKAGGGYQAVEVRPGQTVPEGTVSPSGLSSLTVPTSATRTMAETAPKVKDLVARITNQVAFQEAELGPAASRWAEFMAGKVGAPNPEFTRLRLNMGLLQTLLMRMHVGARGGVQIMEHFKDLVDAGKQSPENLRAALVEIDAYADSVAQAHGVGTTPAPAQPAVDVRLPDGGVMTFPDKKSADAFKTAAGIK